METVKSGLCKPPDSRLINLVGVFETTVDRDNVLNENIHGHSVVFMLLADRQSLSIQDTFRSNAYNVVSVIVPEFVEVADDLALIDAESRFQPGSNDYIWAIDLGTRSGPGSKRKRFRGLLSIQFTWAKAAAWPSKVG